MNQVIDYHAILPELILSGDGAARAGRRRLPAGAAQVARRCRVALLGVLATLGAVLSLLGEHRSTFDGMFVVDNFAILFKLFFLAVAIVVLPSRCGTSARAGSTRGSTTSCC